MASGPIRLGGVAAGSVQGAAAFQAFLRGYPLAVIADIREELNAGGDQLVEAIKSAAPVSDLEGHPGELRDSVHRVEGRHDLSILVVEDAADAKGHPYPAHVEYGHKTKAGGHVAAVPHFWPAVVESKRNIISAMRRRMKARAQAAGL